MTDGPDPLPKKADPALVSPPEGVIEEGPGEINENKVEAAPMRVEGFDRRKLWTIGTLVYTLSGLVVLFCWLLWGDFALSMRDRSVGPLIEKFLLKQGASNTLKQILTATLPTTIALIVGPIISYRSDRLRSRWGRRIPYLIIPTPIAGLAMIGIAFSPQLGEWLYGLMGNTAPADVSIHTAASTYTMSVFTVFWMIFEVAVIVSGSVFGGLINDVVPRPVLGRFHGMFRAISLYDGILFNALLFKHATSHFTLMFALIGLLFGGGFTLMCLKVKEGTYAPPPEDEGQFPDRVNPRSFVKIGAKFGAGLSVILILSFAVNLWRGSTSLTATSVGLLVLYVALCPPVCGGLGYLIGLAVDRKGAGGLHWWGLAFIYQFFARALGYLRECFTQPYYLMIFAMLTLAGLTFRPVNEFSIRFAAQINLADNDYGFLNALSYLCSLTLAFPLGMLVDRFHPIRMGILAMLLYIATTVYGSLFVHNAQTFAVALVAHVVLSGTYFTCTASLAQQLLPRSKFSQYFSANSILVHIVGLLYAPAIGSLLDFTKKPRMVDGQPVVENGQQIYDYAYGLTFWGGLILSCSTLVAMLLVYWRFMKLGGPRGYRAPGDVDPIAPHEPPKRMYSMIGLYLVGALAGGVAGYLALYLFKNGENVPLSSYHNVLKSSKDARDFAIWAISTGVMPGATLGAIFASRWAQKREAAASAA